MTLLEMVVCLAVVALCLVALVRSAGNLSLLAARDADDATLLAQVETLITELEAVPPKLENGAMEDGWRYETALNDGAYVLYVWHEDWQERHAFLLREKTS